MKSIRWRLMATYVALLLVIVGLFETALIYSVRQYYMNTVLNTLKNESQVVSKFYSDFMTYSDLNGTAEQLVETFAKDSYSITIFTPDGLTLTGENVGKQDKTSVVTKPKTVIAGEIATYTVPLYMGSDRVGSMRFATSLTATYATIAQIERYLLAIGGGLVLLGVVLSLALGQTIVRPLKRITATADEMARGQLDKRHAIDRQDEIGQLALSLNEMAEQIQETDRMKHQFISSVSHELRTPLTSIQGWASTISDVYDEQLPERAKYGLTIIRDETTRLSTMVEELLDFSRLQAQKLDIFPEIATLHPLVQSVVLQMQPRAEQQGIALRYVSSDEAAEVYVDLQRIRQVLINVLDNALKFTERGEIVLTTAIESNEYVIHIADTGRGIPPEELPHMLKHFHKSATNKRDKGVGLGLAICHELLRLHGGQLTIASTWQVGTTVTLRLPLEDC